MSLVYFGIRMSAPQLRVEDWCFEGRSGDMMSLLVIRLTGVTEPQLHMSLRLNDTFLSTPLGFEVSLRVNVSAMN